MSSTRVCEEFSTDVGSRKSFLAGAAGMKLHKQRAEYASPPPSKLNGPALKTFLVFPLMGHI